MKHSSLLDSIERIEFIGFGEPTPSGARLLTVDEFNVWRALVNNPDAPAHDRRSNGDALATEHGHSVILRLAEGNMSLAHREAGRTVERPKLTVYAFEKSSRK